MSSRQRWAEIVLAVVVFVFAYLLIDLSWVL
jgi:hypothetical protein